MQVQPASQQPGDSKFLPVVPSGISLSDAVATQPVAYCTRLLAEDPSAINERGWNGLTPLHKACLRGQLDIVEWCLLQQAQVNTANDSGETPLHYAAKRGNPIVLELLLRHGADVMATDDQGKTVVHHAAQGGSVLSLLYFESATDIRLDSVDSSGRSALHYASMNAQKEALQFLLRRERCPLDLQDSRGDTCLHIAVRTGAAHIAYLFLEHPAGFRLQKIKNNSGKTPVEVIQEDTDQIRRNFLTGPVMRFAGMTQNVSQFKKILFVTRLQIFLGPWFIFMGAFLVCCYLIPNKWEPLVYLCAFISCLLTFYRQEHRTLDAMRAQNPIFAGAFFSGLFFTIMCFYTDLMPYVRFTFVPRLAMVLLPICIFLYITLLCMNPGLAPLADPLVQLAHNVNGVPASSRNSDFVELVRRRMDPSYCYCVPCEKPLAHPRVKYCKLCDECYENMDHHCLFLLRCVARSNHWIFVIFLLIVEVGIICFMYSCYLTFHQVCLDHLGEGYLSRIWCFANQKPFVTCMFLFNSPSIFWGIGMIQAQVRSISRGGTSYYWKPSGYKLNICQRIVNIFKFLFTGRVPLVKELAEASFYSKDV